MYRILFICTGNICRSPTAEGIMRRLVSERGLEDKVQVDSAGISSYHQGDMPDLRSIECADRHGLNLRSLRSRPVRAEDFALFDLILAMDETNIEDLAWRRPEGDERYNRAVVRKILAFAPEYGENVPDPYYQNGFDRVYEMLEAACANILTAVEKQL